MEFAIPNFQEFHFLRPLWLLGLIPCLFFLLALWRVNHSVTAWDRAIEKSLLPYLLDRGKSAAQRTPLLLLSTAWLLSVFAMAGPVWEKLPQPVQKREDALVIVMDLSLSMFAADHLPSRLDLTKRKIRDILEIRDEGQTALVVYAGDAHTVTPLTDDTVTISALVPSLSPNIMPLFGSNPGAALELAIGLLDDVEANRGKILLMTDGINGFAEEQTLAQQMSETDYELLIMGIGTEDGAPIRTSDGKFLTDAEGEVVIPKLNRNVLQSLANRAGGRYHDIQLSDADVSSLLAVNPFAEETMSDVEEEFDIWHEAGPWLLILILPVAALSFRRGWLFGMLLFTVGGALFPAQQAQAWEWRDLWQTGDQQGAEAMAAEDAATAASLFESPEWRGVANYRAANYEAAVASFSADNSPDGHYNRGNALAISGNYVEAITAYDQAINLDNNHQDAIFNKELVEKLLEQEESAEGDSDGENSDQQQQQSDEEQEQDEENSDQESQESQEGNQDQEQQQQQQQEAPQEQENSESNSEQNTPSEDSNEEFEEQQSLEQWLRRIEDNPGELLQRKFRFQYRQRQLNGTANNLQSGGQIW
ncbi:MAG: VWA domain-containing protein [Gammaproteobacteria bacterium]|nr:VWA domain-containing protein [Gammaproteobacteria bacterium]